jgi:hypothetical protein
MMMMMKVDSPLMHKRSSKLGKGKGLQKFFFYIHAKLNKIWTVEYDFRTMIFH